MKKITDGARRTLIFLITIISLRAAAQSTAPQAAREITGIVLDAGNAQPLIGASVILEGTTRGVTTDERGEFSIGNLDQGPYWGKRRV
jgi:iron complex outermembrane receptor protein